jgi:hypothetical protein
MPKDVDQMTIDELRARERSLRTVATVVSGLAGAYALALLVGWVTGRWAPSQTLGLVPLFALLAAAFPAWSSRRLVGAELQRRLDRGPRDDRR